MATDEGVVTKLGLPQPYSVSSANFIYNLLFCDAPQLFITEEAKADPAWAMLLGDSTDFDAVRKISDDGDRDSRQRMLSYNLLRKNNQSVPSKVLLGVIFEVPQKEGLDTLAAFADETVRYINYSGKIGVFEKAPACVVEKCNRVIERAKKLVNAIGPWEKARLPPPTRSVRISLLVSDGLYFGEGRYDDLARDPLGGPVLAAGVELLMAATNAGLEKR